MANRIEVEVFRRSSLVDDDDDDDDDDAETHVRDSECAHRRWKGATRNKGVEFVVVSLKLCANHGGRASGRRRRCRARETRWGRRRTATKGA